jgi:hypothetical protein
VHRMPVIDSLLTADCKVFSSSNNVTVKKERYHLDRCHCPFR